MKFQKYIGALVLLLSGLGIFSQYDTVKPNQEIVIQFQGIETSPQNVEDALASVRQKLNHIGVADIEISESQDGTLKISYFSTHEVTEIKRLLFENKGLDISSSNIILEEPNSELPSENTSDSYHLKVFEIQKQSDIGSGLTGKSIIVQKPDIERFLDPNYSLGIFQNQYLDTSRHEEESSLILQGTQVVSVSQSYKIPETRAGPAL